MTDDKMTIEDTKQWIADRLTERLSLSKTTTVEEVQDAVRDVLVEARERGHLSPYADIEQFREYVPALDYTAEQLRAMGMPIKDDIPDCAWIPRECVEFDVDEVTTGEGRTLDLKMTATFSGEFRWISVSV